MQTQKGFTIIELVVVILLLGILTATALPRFMDVTDEAHAAVVDGVVGGFSSGVALYKAQWIADGEPTTGITEFGSLFANTAGYPIGSDATLSTSADCLFVFQNLLQPGGQPTIASITETASALADTDITGATTDFETKLTTGTNVCEYAYTGQFQDAANGDVPVIQYDTDDGSIVLGTAL